MKVAVNPRLRKALKLTVYIIGSFLLLLFILPYFIPDSFNRRIKEFANKSINGKFDYSQASFSFFKEFPALTLTISDLQVNGSKPFINDTLITAKEVSLGINVWALLTNKIQVTLFSINEADIRVEVNENGEANYNIIKTKENSDKKPSSSKDVDMRIQKILIRNSTLNYDDRSSKILIHGNRLNYSGKGDLDAAVFDLYTDLKIDSLDLQYDNVPYIRKKQVAGKLITTINTNSLALKFTDNHLRINKLPIVFNGRFEFLEQGYFMDFSLRSENSRLLDVFTAFPPQYQRWLDETDVKGTANLVAVLKGKYIGDSEQPDFSLDAVIQDGTINNKKADIPLQDLNLSAKFKLPALDPEKLIFDSDSFNFRIGKSEFRSRILVKGLSAPEINTKIKGDVDLQLLDRALGIDSIELKGVAHFNIIADGQYRLGQNPRSIRPDTILLSIPSYNITTSVSNGYIHYAGLNESIHDITLDLIASCPDSNYRNSKIKLENLHAKALNNLVSGKVSWNQQGNNDIAAELKSNLNCEDLKKFVPGLTTNLKGKIDINVHADGNYLPEKKELPVTTGDIRWTGGEIQTPYYPAPIEDIQLLIHATNTTADYQDMNIEIEPIQFRFENQPFQLQATINDLRDPKFNIKSNGVLELGKIYKVFAIEGMDVDGKIYTDISLHGRQSDVMAKRVSRLQNSGILKLEQITVGTEYLPQNVLIDRGTIRFNQDKIFFDNIHTSYQSNLIELNGQLGSVFNYLFEKNGILTGSFDVKSDRLRLDDFRYYAPPDTTVSQDTASTASSGTIVLPENLDLRLNTKFRQLLMQGLTLENFESTGTLKDGQAEITDMHFNLAEGSFNATASYLSKDPSQAFFKLKVKVDSFDIQKAYTQIPMVRIMMPSAATVKGVIGLNYELEGTLDQSMTPVYPSIKGGGEISVKQASLKGFKLMNAVSRSTETSEIRDQDVKKVIIRSTISNNVVTIKRTKMKIAGFRPRFEGQVTLDGKYNLKGRLGLPPLGIIGIPFHVGGSQDNPVIRVRKGHTTQEPPEADDE